MAKKKQRRSPWLWVALIIGFGVLAYALTAPSAYSRIDTSDAMKLIGDGKVASATVTPDRIDLDLSDGETFTGGDVEDAEQVQAFYVESRGEMVVQALEDNPPTDGYTDDPAQQNWLVSLLFTLIPLILILGQIGRAHV